jgi:hypothetical protein
MGITEPLIARYAARGRRATHAGTATKITRSLVGIRDLQSLCFVGECGQYNQTAQMVKQFCHSLLIIFKDRQHNKYERETNCTPLFDQFSSTPDLPLMCDSICRIALTPDLG